MSAEQDELIRRLMAGEFGPWGGQGFVPGGITILRPDTGQWETITAVAGSADLTYSELGEPVDISGLEVDPNYVLGLPMDIGLPAAIPSIGGGLGRPLLSAVPAASYTYLDFTRTDLGHIRMTVGISNGATGPLAPIRMGSANDEVDKDGNLWLPRVRFF